MTPEGVLVGELDFMVVQAEDGKWRGAGMLQPHMR